MGRRTLVLVVALLLAAVATFAVYNFLSGVEEEAAKDRTYQVVFRSSETDSSKPVFSRTSSSVMPG